MHRFRKSILELLWLLAIIPSFCGMLGAAAWNARQTVSSDPSVATSWLDALLAELDTDQNGLIQMGRDHVFDGLVFGLPFLFVLLALCIARWWRQTDEPDIRGSSKETSVG